MLSVQPCSVLTPLTRGVFGQKWEGRDRAGSSSARTDTARQQQWATGKESAERRGNRTASPETPGGGAVVTRFLRTGCTVLRQSSKNLVGSEFTIARPFPFAVYGEKVAA